MTIIHETPTTEGTYIIKDRKGQIVGIAQPTPETPNSRAAFQSIFLNHHAEKWWTGAEEDFTHTVAPSKDPENEFYLICRDGAGHRTETPLRPTEKEAQQLLEETQQRLEDILQWTKSKGVEDLFKSAIDHDRHRIKSIESRIQDLEQASN